MFLDANVLFSAAYRTNSRLRRLWQVYDIQLCTSHYAVEEARRNLATAEQRDELDTLTQPMQLMPYPGSLNHPIFLTIVLPEKDRPILLAAMLARATHLLTGDQQHFGPYFGQTIEGVLIVPPVVDLHAVTPSSGTKKMSTTS